MRNTTVWSLTTTAGLLVLLVVVGDSEPKACLGADSFEQSIRPLLLSHCNTCHSSQKHEGELDLQQFESLEQVKKNPEIWERVQEQLTLGEMPPKDARQLPPVQMKLLMQWVGTTLDEIAIASAGDPGPVVLRRLSNHEYTYTLRDLTGVESLDPAREFPVDGAAGEGFTNVGAALVMSPALLAKYLDAAKDVAAHAVFTPHGIRWSASTSAQDWTDECLARIRTIYAKYTIAGESSQTVAQGIKLDTGTDGGRMPLAMYLDALQGRGSAEGLSPKYLRILQQALTNDTPSPLLGPLRAKFRQQMLFASDIERWQQVLWRFTTIGHIGKLGGPKAWQEPVTPLVPKNEIRVKLADDRDQTLYLTTTDAGDGNASDDVFWENPRLVSANRPELPLKTLPALLKHIEAVRTRIIDTTEQCLNCVATGADDADPELVNAWREYLGYGGTKLEPLLTKKMNRHTDYDFIKGWQGERDLSVLANSSDAAVRIPGHMKAHSVATHPSPTHASVIAWRCEQSGSLRINGDIVDAHPECGNGVTWALEVRRGHATETLASGNTKGAEVSKFGPFDDVLVNVGQVIALVIGPKDGNHVCDLTSVNLTFRDGKKSWDLATDVSPDILKGNPHGPWHFVSQPATYEASSDLPAPIAAWRTNPSPESAKKVKAFLERDFPLTSPLLRPFLNARLELSKPADLTAKAPSVIEVKIPAALAKGAEFVVTGKLALRSGGSVQMQVLTQKPDSTTSLIAGKSESALKSGQWSDNNLVTQHSAPVIVHDDSEARRRFDTAFDEFRALFPIALCYPRIVPVDEVVTLTLYYREDEHLRRLMLNEAETQALDRAWEELHFVSESPLKQVAAFEQIWQFATQDAKPEVFEPMRQPILKAAAKFKEQQQAAIDPQKAAVLAFAERAWRRPLTEQELSDLKAFQPRAMLVRVLASPAFLYRAETPAQETGPINDWELATRLSYFLWSSLPDEELRSLASIGKLREPDILAAQARRMLKDEHKIRRLATEFGCQFLHVRDVAILDEKSERHFPHFKQLRDAMQEEVARFCIDLFQHDRSVLELIEADYTFLNKPLAEHYGIPFEGTRWQRVDGLHQYGRGGALGFAATLAKHSGASRTSAILRGTWLSEVLLGEKIPNPPKGVPTLPEEAPQGLSERQLIERHSSEDRCAGCHRRIDPYGFALEGFDAIGRSRTADTKTVLYDGTKVDGMLELQKYIAGQRRTDFVRQFSRKLLGYSLGRSVQLSDQPLIDSLVATEGHRVGNMVEKIVRSRQFREIRGGP